MKKLTLVTAIALACLCTRGFAQQDTASRRIVRDQLSAITDSTQQRDAIDLIRQVLDHQSPANTREKAKRLNFSIVPAVGYSLSTGFAVDGTANVAFYTTSSHKENLSDIDAEAVFDTKNQKILISRAEIWKADNDYKLVTDVRVEKYPIDTYGLGTSATNATDNPLVYNYLRLWGTVFKKVIPDWYIGAGYQYDYHYNITQQGTVNKTVSDYTLYGFSPTSTSSGPVINLLYDSRRNPINPLGGAYLSILYRDNFQALGSDNGWREFQVEAKKFFRLSPANNNVLAFWSIVEFTNGDVPYLDLPATGFDTYNNSGRGYAEQRFRGHNMLYLESEYRFGITKNGLLGGVVFANAESLSEFQTNRFAKVAPAMGTGIRIKVNKHSDTNVCLDYAAGLYGSRGLFVNLGEMF